jgi:hypothetical protein
VTANPDLIEEAARAACVAAGNDPNSTVGRLDPATGEYHPLWQAYAPTARAAVAVALERAAGVAETAYVKPGVWQNLTVERIAAAIRSLAGQ